MDNRALDESKQAPTLHERLLELASRLQGDDSATVFSAAMQLAPMPKPTIEKLSQPVPGLLHHFRYYGS